MARPVVDVDFKDRDNYNFYCGEDEDEPWHVVLAISKDDKIMDWAILQMLQSKDDEADFKWAVFMKTGKCGSNALKYTSKRFTDQITALRTFGEWFAEKTNNNWTGDVGQTEDKFVQQEGFYSIMDNDKAEILITSRGKKCRGRPSLVDSDIPVDMYFKNRDDYQVYECEKGKPWTVVLSKKKGSRHTDYVLLQLLVCKPSISVDFDFAVYMRNGKMGGSAQRYTKRYVLEEAAQETFIKWFEEKTENQWLEDPIELKETFEEKPDSFVVLQKDEWSDAVEFEETKKSEQLPTDVEVDRNYKDRGLYKVYCTDEGLWAAVLSSIENGVYKKFVLLQMLIATPESQVEYRCVVFKRIGERTESGQWTAKKFTNEFDALRAFRLIFEEETDNIWKGSLENTMKTFSPVAGKLNLTPRDKWEIATRQDPIVINVKEFFSQKENREALQKQIVDSDSSKPREGSVDDTFDKHSDYNLAEEVRLIKGEKKKRYCLLQIVEAAPNNENIPESEKFAVLNRSGKSGSKSAASPSYFKSMDAAVKFFKKKFNEKTLNQWQSSWDSTMREFEAQPDMFTLTKEAIPY